LLAIFVEITELSMQLKQQSIKRAKCVRKSMHILSARADSDYSYESIDVGAEQEYLRDESGPSAARRGRKL
jgi:hypothetical protein